MDENDREILYRLDEHVRNHMEHAVRRIERFQYAIFVTVIAAVLVDIFVR
jgi:hypothetical protein